MSNHLETDSLQTLIKAVENYREELEVNKKILVNAADVCDAAMGSDDIAKKHIAKLNEALGELDKTSKLAEEVAKALKEDLRMAQSVMDD
ncbi:MAG: hypothetical protein ACLU5E_01675 [Anaerovoracaceae bacterium]